MEVYRYLMWCLSDISHRRIIAHRMDGESKSQLFIALRPIIQALDCFTPMSASMAGNSLLLQNTHSATVPGKGNAFCLRETVTARDPAGPPSPDGPTAHIATRDFVPLTDLHSWFLRWRVAFSFVPKRGSEALPASDGCPIFGPPHRPTGHRHTLPHFFFFFFFKLIEAREKSKIGVTEKILKFSYTHDGFEAIVREMKIYTRWGCTELPIPPHRARSSIRYLVTITVGEHKIIFKCEQ